MTKSLLKTSLLTILLLTSTQAKAANRGGADEQPRTLSAESGYPGDFGTCDFKQAPAAHAIVAAREAALEKAAESCNDVLLIGLRALQTELLGCRGWTPYYKATVEIRYVCND